MKRKKLRPRQTNTKIPCPFCDQIFPPFRQLDEVFTGEGCLGGLCECGAAFVVDATGKSGGQALLDAQALVCQGDLDRAIAIDSNTELEIKHVAYQIPASRLAGRNPRGMALLPKLWVVRLRKQSQ